MPTKKNIYIVNLNLNYQLSDFDNLSRAERIAKIQTLVDNTQASFIVWLSLNAPDIIIKKSLRNIGVLIVKIVDDKNVDKLKTCPLVKGVFKDQKISI